MTHVRLHLRANRPTEVSWRFHAVSLELLVQQVGCQRPVLRQSSSRARSGEVSLWSVVQPTHESLVQQVGGELHDAVLLHLVVQLLPNRALPTTCLPHRLPIYHTLCGQLWRGTGTTPLWQRGLCTLLGRWRRRQTRRRGTRCFYWQRHAVRSIASTRIPQRIWISLPGRLAKCVTLAVRFRIGLRLTKHFRFHPVRIHSFEAAFLGRPTPDASSRIDGQLLPPSRFWRALQERRRHTHWPVTVSFDGRATVRRACAAHTQATPVRF
mmetsp:Transcript_52892/g.141338  ORF Transcript_52892/g.141338 Transcript_52892/m.141338 type:complete len:267 (-) Transcript_52892:332-1132(-)